MCFNVRQSETDGSIYFEVRNQSFGHPVVYTPSRHATIMREFPLAH